MAGARRDPGSGRAAFGERARARWRPVRPAGESSRTAVVRGVRLVRCSSQRRPRRCSATGCHPDSGCSSSGGSSCVTSGAPKRCTVWSGGPPRREVTGSRSDGVPVLDRFPRSTTISSAGLARSWRSLDAIAAHPVVSIVGVGGMGKTRLALETAAASEFADGAWWCDLTAATTPEAVPVDGPRGSRRPATSAGRSASAEHRRSSRGAARARRVRQL